MKTTNPQDYIDLLKVFRTCLAFGFLDKQKIIGWADNIIQQDDQPDIFFIELSLCGRKSVNDIVSLLSSFLGDNNSGFSYRAVLGFSYRSLASGHITIDKVNSYIDRFIWCDSQLPGIEKNLLYGIVEDYEMFLARYSGSIESITENTLKTLSVYQEFDIDNFFQWDEINKNLITKLVELDKEHDDVSSMSKPKLFWLKKLFTKLK